MKKFIILILSLSIISCFCFQPMTAFAETNETSNEISDVNHDITIKSDIVVNSCSFTTSENDEICLSINFSDGEKNYFENLRFSLIYDSPFPDSVPRYVGDFKSGTKDVMFFQVLNKPDSLYLHQEITSEEPIFEIVIADQKEYCVFDIKHTISSEVYNFLANSAMNIDDFSSESERIGKVNQINCDPCWKETLELAKWFEDNPHAFNNINDENTSVNIDDNSCTSEILKANNATFNDIPTSRISSKAYTPQNYVLKLTSNDYNDVLQDGVSYDGITCCNHLTSVTAKLISMALKNNNVFYKTNKPVIITVLKDNNYEDIIIFTSSLHQSRKDNNIYSNQWIRFKIKHKLFPVDPLKPVVKKMTADFTIEDEGTFLTCSNASINAHGKNISRVYNSPFWIESPRMITTLDPIIEKINTCGDTMETSTLNFFVKEWFSYHGDTSKSENLYKLASYAQACLSLMQLDKNVFGATTKTLVKLAKYAIPEDINSETICFAADGFIPETAWGAFEHIKKTNDGITYKQLGTKSEANLQFHISQNNGRDSLDHVTKDHVQFATLFWDISGVNNNKARISTMLDIKINSTFGSTTISDYICTTPYTYD